MTVNSVAVPHILLIDDNPDQLRLLVEALREGAYRITVAFDGAQGYARAVALLPDLILLDVRMPKGDGFTVARRLKANPETEQIPVLFLSASVELDERLTGLRSGGVDYIVKPFQPEEVIERVRIHLELALNRKNARAAVAAGQDVSAENVSFSPSQAAQYRTGDLDKETAGIGESVLLRAAKRIVSDMLGNPPSPAELAGKLGVSEHRITSIFNQETGMSLFEFMRRERMSKASRLLAQTDWSITDIAAEVGYSSPANFSTAFREYYAATPSGYRKKLFKKNQPEGTPDSPEPGVNSDS